LAATKRRHLNYEPL